MERKKHSLSLLILFFSIVVILILSAYFFFTTPKETEDNTPMVLSAQDSVSVVEKDIVPTISCTISNRNFTITDAIENTIVTFLDSYYTALATLETTDITHFFAKEETTQIENAKLNQASLDYLIALRQMQTNDLTITDFSFTLSYEEVSQLDDGTIEVIITESHAANFSFLNGITSYASGIEHVFQCDTAGNLLAHTRSEDIYPFIEEKYLAYKETISDQTMTADEINATIEQITADLLEEAQTDVTNVLQQRSAYLQDPAKYEETNLTWDVDYNREAAVNYAKQWVSGTEIIRNTDEWEVYDMYGGNCNNYISQCLDAGGIPMDYFGESSAQWKWYSTILNYSQTAAGRSPSWAGVNEFYQYCCENTGYGLVSLPDANLFSAKEGDILQFGMLGTWKHSVIVTDLVYDAQGNICDLLIHSNTTDRINYPASAYAYSTVRLIRILGYNQ